MRGLKIGWFLEGLSDAAIVADGLEITDRDGPFGLAEVDLILADGNGADLVRRLKAAYPETRVAVLSASANLTGSLEAEADEAINKMVPLPEIVARLEALARAGGAARRRSPAQQASVGRPSRRRRRVSSTTWSISPSVGPSVSQRSPSKQRWAGASKGRRTCGRARRRHRSR